MTFFFGVGGYLHYHSFLCFLDWNTIITAEIKLLQLKSNILRNNYQHLCSFFPRNSLKEDETNTGAHCKINLFLYCTTA